MPLPDRRRSPRTAVWLRAKVRVGDEEELAYAGEIGLRGAYVAIPEPRPRHQLLSLTFALPEGGEMDVHCMVVRAVTAEEARRRSIPPGMAVQFYGMSTQARERWEKAFFRVLTGRSGRTSPESTPEDPTARAPKPPSLVIVPEGEDPFRLPVADPPPPVEGSDGAAPGELAEVDSANDSGERDSAEWGSWFDYFLGEAVAAAERERSEVASQDGGPRAGAVEGAEAPDATTGPVLYRLTLPTAQVLRGFAMSALSARGIFVHTDDPRPTGTPAVVCIVHPDSGDELHLPGEVVEVNTERQGVGVAFLGEPARMASDILSFVGGPQGGPPATGGDSGGPEGGTLTHTDKHRRTDRDEAVENAEDIEPAGLMVLTGAPAEGGGSHDVEELSVADLIELEED